MDFSETPIFDDFDDSSASKQDAAPGSTAHQPAASHQHDPAPLTKGSSWADEVDDWAGDGPSWADEEPVPSAQPHEELVSCTLNYHHHSSSTRRHLVNLSPKMFVGTGQTSRLSVPHSHEDRPKHPSHRHRHHGRLLLWKKPSLRISMSSKKLRC